jgi:hypothetical protein
MKRAHFYNGLWFIVNSCLLQLEKVSVLFVIEFLYAPAEMMVDTPP